MLVKQRKKFQLNDFKSVKKFYLNIMYVCEVYEFINEVVSFQKRIVYDKI